MNGKRRIWGMIFLVSGLVALIAVGLVTLTRVPALPVAAVSWPLTIYAGYRMWKAAHPAASVWRELSRRGLAVGTFGATVIAALLFVSFPQVVVGIVVVWIAVLFALFTAVTLAERTRQ